MALVEELYGHRLTGESRDNAPQGPPATQVDPLLFRGARCPFMNAICDGGGNRDMARISASDESLGPYFDRSVGKITDGYIPCGVCSVRLPRDGIVWAICPRRLFCFTKEGVGEQHAELANRIFSVAGYRAGDEISVWSEVSLRESGENDRSFNYRLDYVLRSVERASQPVIVEVMTCSTSGGNKSQGKDIQGAFRRAVISTHSLPSHVGSIEAPGVNVRQVWARMASQMIAKSEAANSWGGCTIWVVQDTLVDYVRKNTALPLDQLHSQDWAPGEVNMLVSDLTQPVALYSGPIRPGGDSKACWMDLLGAPHIPTLSSLTKKLDDAQPLVTFRVPPSP